MATKQPLTYDNFAQEVRAFMRDLPELNRLIQGEETSNRLIAYCTFLAVDEYNTTPPLIGAATISTFPSRSILLQLTLIHVLTSVGLLHSRNRFSYNDGGFSVETEQQEGLYKQWIQMFRAQVGPRIMSLKIAQNIEGGWNAGVGSEYGMINGWYGFV